MSLIPLIEILYLSVMEVIRSPLIDQTWGYGSSVGADASK
jgi:hypothetical protein